MFEVVELALVLKKKHYRILKPKLASTGGTSSLIVQGYPKNLTSRFTWNWKSSLCSLKYLKYELENSWKLTVLLKRSIVSCIALNGFFFQNKTKCKTNYKPNVSVRIEASSWVTELTSEGASLRQKPTELDHQEPTSM